jgi:glycosyltransferase involved in cell wall biosynthesis
VISKIRLPVSVIIPCYCCGTTIKRALRSIYSQVALPAEVIIVDDCSIDDTYSVLSSLVTECVELIIIKMNVNQGAASARNSGWRQASQPYIAFLDADDSWHSEKLWMQYQFMDTNKDVVMSGHHCVLLHHDQCAPSLLDTSNVKIIGRMQVLLKNPFNTPSVMLRRDIPFRFKEGKRYAEDYLLWQQIILSNMKVACIEQPLAYVHKPLYGAGGLSKNLIKMEFGVIQNFLILFKTKYIGIPTLVFSIIFSLMKFSRRFIISFFKRNF